MCKINSHIRHQLRKILHFCCFVKPLYVVRSVVYKELHYDNNGRVYYTNRSAYQVNGLPTTHYMDRESADEAAAKLNSGAYEISGQWVLPRGWRDRKRNEMKPKTVLTMTYIFAVILFAIGSLWIGKTTVNDWHVTIERPVTAVLFFLAMIASLFNI